ncbi:MAG: outer membrane protein assembly factor [Bacteroidales bacterium]|jgi:outer membrane translocation and assembly module TamA|nr:outer membrane protein assembly factor [Bacteroidales bacterium]
MIFSFVFVGCLPERKLKETEYLLVKNKIIADKKKDIPTNDMVYTVRPRVNKRTFGMFLWGVGIYQAMIPKEKPQYEQFKRKMRNTFGKYPVLLDTVTNDYYTAQWDKLRLWTQKNFGSAPVLLDSSLINYSLAQIKLTMLNIGYFDAKIDYKVKFTDKRAKVFYYITSGEPYRINQITYQLPDDIANYVYQDTARAQIQRGDIFTVENMENRRNEISERLLNAGYYNFSKDYVRYEVDTNLGGQLLNLKLVISNPYYRIDDTTLVEGKHRRYIVNTINIISNFSNWDDFLSMDTIQYMEVVKKNQDTNYYIVYYPPNQKDYRPSALVYPVFFSSGDMYSSRLSRSTYDRYSEMHNFNFIKVSYSETEDSKRNFIRDTGYLDCQIQLTKSKKQSLGFDLLAKNSGGIFGVAGELSYRNRNLFKAAEIFTFSLKYTQELRMDSSKANFQNFELGGNIMLEFPRFLFPIKQQNIPKAFRPKTWMGLGGDYLRQQYYSRLLTNFIFTYEWNERKPGQRIHHSLSVLDFSLIKMYRDSLFDASIAQYAFSQRILEKYKDHFLLGSNYRITLQDAHRYVFRARFDMYGNLLYATMRAFGKLTDKYKNAYNQYSIWGIPFASGLTMDFDFTYNILQKKKSSLVYHLTFGIGFSTMNSSVLPFEKSFYLGGSNSMRAWRLRMLGPGSYADSNASVIAAERIGDIKFETNLEYRTPVYKILHIGLFVDAGNIWLMKKNEVLPNGEFAFNRFFKEIALDVGIGLRLDLSFFVIRMDYALKIHDPGRTDNTWSFLNWHNFKSFSNDGTFVLGIGYPF